MKPTQRAALMARAERALSNLYHNATPSYPRIDDDKEAAAFDSWFPDAAQFEIEYLQDGAYGRNYRETLSAPCNTGRYKSQRARDYYVAKGMRDMRAERSDCGTLTGWRMLELAAGNKTLARDLTKFAKRQGTLSRNNAMWEWISEYGKLYQYGRGGRTLAPCDLIRERGGSSFSVKEDATEGMNAERLTEFVRVLESFNRVVGSWCESVPEQWREEWKTIKAAERNAKRDAKRRANLIKCFC